MYSPVSQAKIDTERLENTKHESSSFIQNIFSGEAKVSNFFPYPKVLSEDELQFIEMVTEPALKMYATEYDPLKVEENNKLEDKHLQLLKDLGTFGIQVMHIFNIIKT